MMPKVIITKATLPVALHELDKWSGKLTWELYAGRLAECLGFKRISRHTLLSYPALVEAFTARKEALKEKSASNEGVRDFSMDFAKGQIDILEAKVARLEKENAGLQQQFVRWQYNTYMMPGADMERLRIQLEKPFVAVNRR